MKLIRNKRIITEPIKSILEKVRKETGYLDDIYQRRRDVVCTCPWHSDGHEQSPACYVRDDDTGEVEYGTFHCFACGQSGTLDKLISKCYNRSLEWAKDWLVYNYGDSYIEEIEFLPTLIQEKENHILEESYLDQFDYNNAEAIDYLTNKRHLSKEIVDKFKIGCDGENITFPIRDEHGNLLGVSRRSIKGKFFHIPKEIEVKPVYLLDSVILNSESPVYVCESQINALTLRSWGFYAIALFGTGSKEQYKILNKSGIRNYILAFDGDFAGDTGANKFVNNIKTAVITQILIPRGKDVNDLSKDEFLSLERVPR